MSVYRRGEGPYCYDFWLDGRRHTGPTGTTDLEVATAFEASVRDSNLALGVVSRAVLRRARRHLPTGRRADQGYVYILQAGYFIKIGHSQDPAERLRTLNTASPHDCELLLCIPGGTALERRLHQEFAASHYRREWFFFCGKLKQFVAELTAGNADASAKVPPHPRQEIDGDMEVIGSA